MSPRGKGVVPLNLNYQQFRAMRCSRDSAPPKPDEVYYAHGLIIADAENGGPLRQQVHPQTALLSGTTSASKIQALVVFTPGATPHYVVVIDGAVYLDGTLSVTQANFATAGITFSTTAEVYGVQFGALLVLHDGTNRPFTWDGTAGAGGLASLTNAPSKVFGRPVVYYGKLFFIKNVAAADADRSTLVWSEENQANTGYEAGGFNNAWTLTQSGQGSMYALVATNEALYYWRRDSVGKITGAVTPDFAAAGVTDSVSQASGTISPRGACYYEGYLWWVSPTKRPFRVPVGGRGAEPIWTDIAADIDAYLPPSTSAVSVDPCPMYHGVLVGFARAGGTSCDMQYVFSYRTGRCLGRLGLPSPITTYPKETVSLRDDTGQLKMIQYVASAGLNGLGSAVYKLQALEGNWSVANGTDIPWFVLVPFGDQSAARVMTRLMELDLTVSFGQTATNPATSVSVTPVELRSVSHVSTEWSPDAAHLTAIGAAQSVGVPGFLNRAGFRHAAWGLQSLRRGGYFGLQFSGLAGAATTAFLQVESIHVDGAYEAVTAGFVDATT